MEAVDGHDYRGVREAGVRQGQEVEVVVDEVELFRLLEDLRDVQPLPDLGVEGAVFLVTGGGDGPQVGGGQGVRGGE
jgi:hypothetical protein